MKRVDKSKSNYQLIRRASGVIELGCPHGVGHPIKIPVGDHSGELSSWWSHGCDGCCGKSLFLIEKEKVLALLSSLQAL